MSNLNLRFNANEYVRSHGKNPRGRGIWAFAEVQTNGTGDPIFTPRSMTLTAAKTWFREYLKAQGVTGVFEIKVCP